MGTTSNHGSWFVDHGCLPAIHSLKGVYPQADLGHAGQVECLFLFVAQPSGAAHGAPSSACGAQGPEYRAGTHGLSACYLLGRQGSTEA